MKLTIGVLALQGCVTPHRFHIEALGAQYKEVRKISDCDNIDALILPGGESTTMLKLIKDFHLEADLIDICRRMPVWGICAGAILMAKTVLSPEQRSFGILDITIKRNAYGSQLNSFNEIIENSSVSFIRAPIIQAVGSNVVIKKTHSNNPVWVQEGRYMATTFHPELATNQPSYMHKYFLNIVSEILYHI